MVTPVPVPPSPNVHAYEVVLVLADPSKLQVRPLQLFVKLATGAGGVFETVTGCVDELVPLASVTVRVTLYVPDAA